MHEGSGGGVSNYERELANNLKDITDINLITKFTKPPKIPVIDPHLRRPLVVRKMINQMDSADLVHLPSQQYAPALIKSDFDRPVVVTVHDLIPYVTNLTPFYRKLSSHLSVEGLKIADQIICISKHTKNDILKHTKISEKQISVVYPSAELEFDEISDSQYINEKYDISGEYILYVGSKAKRKNIFTLIRSLKYTPDINLVLVGRAPFPFKSKKIEAYSRIHGVSERVIQTGYVEKEELGRFYKDTLAFVFPSLYEGFGRPPLEAMSMGTPVIASSATAIPEVVNDACLLCDPTQATEWADAVQQIRDDENLAKELISAGHKRADEFDFEKTAIKTKNIYDKII